MSAYTDADVQAAAKAIARLSIQGTASWLDYSRAAVDAVAPAIAARALREAAWEWESLVQREKPPVRGSSWLARRADEIERTP